MFSMLMNDVKFNASFIYEYLLEAESAIFIMSRIKWEFVV